MRTKEEILKRLGEIKENDFLGFRFEVLTQYLSADDLKPFLKEGTDLSKWEPKPLDEESVKKELFDYLEFAWDKAENHRGISASRSIEKLSEWLWVLGDEETLKKVEEAEYPQYGAPKLKVIAEAYGRPPPTGSVIDNMMHGIPCGDYEGCGCG